MNKSAKQHKTSLNYLNTMIKKSLSLALVLALILSNLFTLPVMATGVPNAPTATGGVEKVDVTGVLAGATVKLYLTNGTLVSSTPTDMGGGTYRFSNVTPNSLGFYVTQTDGGVESLNTPFFGVDLRTPGISGGVKLVDVSNIYSGADVTLYNSSGNTVATAANVTGGTKQFTNITPGGGYYVIQSINGVVSTATSMVSVSDDVPNAPTATGGEEQVDVTGVTAGATVKLYLTNGTLVSSTPTDMGGGAYRFSNVIPNSLGFYVTQTVGGVESQNTPFFGVSLRTPGISGGVKLVDVSNIYSGADVTLYNSSGNTTVATATNVTGGTKQFTNVTPGGGYYVVQSINGVVSSATSMVSVSDDVPNAPTATGGEEKVDVTGVTAGATIKLYLTNGTLVSSTPTDMGGGTYRFSNVTPNSLGFYVTQTVGGVESQNTPFFGVDLRTPGTSGGVKLVDVSNIYSGADVTLYNSSGNTVATATNVTTGTKQFTNVTPGEGYYVIQSINGVVSTASSMVSVSDNMNVTSVRMAEFNISSSPIQAQIEVGMDDLGLGASNFTIVDSTNPSSTVTVSNAAYSAGKYSLYVSGMTMYDAYTLSIEKTGYTTYTNNSFFGTLAAESDLDMVHELNMFPSFSRSLTSPGIVTIGNSSYAANAALYSGATYTAIDTNNGNPDNGSAVRYIGIFDKAPNGAKGVKTLRTNGQMVQVGEDSLIDSNPNYQETVASGKTDPSNIYSSTISFLPMYSEIATARQTDNSRILEDAADRFRIIEWYDNDACTGTPIKVTRLMVKVEYTGSVNLVPAAPTNPVQDDTANTFGWTNASGYTNASDYEYSVDNGSTWTSASANPQNVGNFNYASGAVQVRVKANTTAGRAASAVLASTAAYTSVGGAVHLTSGTTTTDYSTIQTALNAATNGDVINVDSGTFREQLTITKNVTIQGAGIGQTIIESPDNSLLTQSGGNWRNLKNQDVYAVVGIKTVTNGTVVLKDLTVDGRDQGYRASYESDARGGIQAGYDFQGIGVFNTNVTIDTVKVTGVRELSVNGGSTALPSGYTPTDQPSGANHNEAIFAESAVGAGTHTLVVKNSTVTKFQKTGILAWGPTLIVDIHDNTIQGYGKTLWSTGNGMQISSSDRTGQGEANGDRRGTAGSIVNNHILDIGLIVPAPGNAGSLLKGAGYDGPSGILLNSTADNFLVKGNTITREYMPSWHVSATSDDGMGTTNYGINVSNSNNAVVQDNTVSGYDIGIIEGSANDNSSLVVSGNTLASNTVSIFTAKGNDQISLADGNMTVAYYETGNGVDTITNFGVGDKIRVIGFMTGSIDGNIGTNPIPVADTSGGSSTNGYTDAHPVVDFTNGTVTNGDGTNVAAHSVQVSVSGSITTLYIDTDGTADAAELEIHLAGVYVPANFILDGSYIKYVTVPNAPTYTVPSPQTSVTTAISGNIVDEKTGKTIKGIPVKVTVAANGTKTLEVKPEETILIEQADGTNSVVGDLSKISFSAPAVNGTNVNGPGIVINNDGTIAFNNLANGTNTEFRIMMDVGNGQKLVIGKIVINISDKGEVSLTSTLIDPYGVITDSVTGQPVVGAELTLYYADTVRNRSNGKTPNTIVALPGIAGFKPNNNNNPQVSDAAGFYGYMVFPTSDYYIIATKDGYKKYTSPTIAVEQELVKFDFQMKKINLTKPVITLIGDTEITIKMNDGYNDAGATAKDSSNVDLTSKIASANRVNTKIPGKYTVVYDVTDDNGNKADSVTRTVNVIDTRKPVIHLIGSSRISIKQGVKYNEYGATAKDGKGIDITDKIIISGKVNTKVAGDYEISYSVKDALGYESSKIRTVQVISTAKPLLTLKGAKELSIKQGDKFKDPGAKAIDNKNRDISNKVVAKGMVNTKVPGDYSIVYSVTDEDGNIAESITRTVKVISTEKPVITLIGRYNVTVKINDSYKDAGATAKDNQNNDLTDKIITSGEVDTAMVGDYVITYNVVDAYGNTANTVTRTVHVVKTSEQGTKPVKPIQKAKPAKAQSKYKTAIIAGKTDSISGSVLAGKTNGLVLTPASYSLIKVNKAVDTAYILGGNKVIDKNVEKQIHAYGVKKIVRIGGANAYETSEMIAKKMKIGKGTPVLLISNKTPIALVKVVIAKNNKNYPIILTTSKSLNKYAKQSLNSIKPAKTYIIGDIKAISSSQEKEIHNMKSSLMRVKTIMETYKIK